MTNKGSLYKSILFYFFVFIILFSIIFVICYFEAYGFEEGITNSESARIKLEVIRRLTFVTRIIGDEFFTNSKIYSSLFLPIAVFIDSLVCAVASKMIEYFILALIYKIKKIIG
jgi:hypothetical protein